MASLHADSSMVGYKWYGVVPPQYILSNRKFRGVALEPPSFEPGSWIGAGNVLVDYDTEEFWMTARPRIRGERGYAAEIYRSTNGEKYTKVISLGKSLLSGMANAKIDSIEGTQMLRDPLTGRFYLYVSADVGDRQWDTLLFISEDPSGPWNFRCVSLKRGSEYDAAEARDGAYAIIDGVYMCLYKANPSGSDVDATKLSVALAVSQDGIQWTKLGILKIADKPTPPYMFLSGSLFPSSSGPIFIGIENNDKIGKAHVARKFVAYAINRNNMTLLPVFQDTWTPLSPYERRDWPIHGYMDVVHDPFRDRILLYIEAVDPNHEVGLDLEVDRVLLYEVPL